MQSAQNELYVAMGLGNFRVRVDRGIDRAENSCRRGVREVPRRQCFWDSCELTRLSHTRVVEIAQRFGRQGGEDDQGIFKGDMVREDESASAQMISKMGRQSVRYAG